MLDNKLYFSPFSFEEEERTGEEVSEPEIPESSPEDEPTKEDESTKDDEDEEEEIE